MPDEKKLPPLQPLEVALPKDTSNIPLLYANQLIVNFTGNEFLVTVICAVPEPWVAGEVVNAKVTARVLGRFAVANHHWQQTVASIANQIESLRAQGALDRVPSPPETET